MAGSWAWIGTRVAVGLFLWAAPASSNPDARVWLEARSRQVQRERSSLAKVARSALPSVVSITTLPVEPEPHEAEPQKGVGAGFFIHPSGFILTSAHVVIGSASVTVTALSPQGQPEDYVAKIVGMDERTDTALLKIEGTRPFPVLRLSSVSRVDLADWIVVIGSPFGLTHSVTVGVVSFKGRAEVTPNGREGDFDYLQTDAAINPGNSGGPVLDLHGEVVAIANAVNVAGQGIGFAIPVDIAKAILPQLHAKGRVERGWVGLAVQDLAGMEAIERGAETSVGVVVTDITAGSPADRAGLQVGDVVVGLGETQVDRAQTLRWQVASRGVGHSVLLKVRRAGMLRQVRMKLEATPPEKVSSRPAKHP